MAPRTTTPDPVTYLLRDVDGALWATFKARADDDDVSLRDALVQLVAAYAAGDLALTPAAQPRARAVARRGRKA